jgi:hypothetical protein
LIERRLTAPRFVCAVAALLGLGVCAAKAQTPAHGIQSAFIALTVDERGELWVSFDSVGHPYAFDARKLHFAWSPYGAYGGGPSSTMTPAKVSIGRWEPVDIYPRWQPTGSDRFIARQYRAPIDLGAMQAPGMYRLTVSNDLDLGQTDHGEALSVGNRRVAEVYFPDERNDDHAVTELRGRILGRNVYAFGSSLEPMKVTNVTRSSSDAMMSYGLPAHERRQSICGDTPYRRHVRRRTTLPLCGSMAGRRHDHNAHAATEYRLDDNGRHYPQRGGLVGRVSRRIRNGAILQCS